MYNLLKNTTMKKALILSIVLAAAFMTLSCEKEKWNDLTLTGKGDIVSLSLELGSFSRIELSGVANLYLSTGDEQRTTLKAQQNIIEVLTWGVSGNTLIIGLREGVSLRQHEEIRFEIKLPELSSLLHDGVGDVHLKGESQNELDIDFRGIGKVNAYELPLDHCVVLHSGIGDCRVMVNKTLEADITSIGNIFYRGNPQINCSDSGLGDLIDDN